MLEHKFDLKSKLYRMVHNYGVNEIYSHVNSFFGAKPEKYWGI